MAAGTVANYASTVLKTLFSSKAIDDATLSESPARGMMNKNEDFGGYDSRSLLFYGDLQGVGNVFSTAQSSIANPSDAAYTITRKECYALAALEGWLIEAAKKGERASFCSALQRHMDSALHAIATNTMSHQIYRNTYGHRGTATASTTTITLTNANDIVLFEKGMPLVASATDGGALLSATACTVATVNRGAGTFTTSVDMSASWTGTFYLYRATDSDGTTAAAPSGLCITGLRGWMPSTVGTLFGQDCTLDSQRLAGGRYAGTGSMRECMNGAVAVADRDGQKWDTIVMPPDYYAKLVNELSTNVRYAQAPAMTSKGPSATIGFAGIETVGPSGKMVKVFADRWCQSGLAYALKMDTWTVMSLNKAPHILDLDGLVMMRSATANTYELRWGASWQLHCSNPGDNMVITLPT